MGQYNSPQEFITALVPGAQAGYAKTGIFASVMIAQALGEAGWQMSQKCAYEDNNLFGVKYDGNHDKTITITVGSEPSDGTGGRYAHYQSIADGGQDYGVFLQTNPRYSEAGVFSATTPQAQVDAIANAGYATSDGYGDFIKQLISENNLEQYDTGTSGASTGSTSDPSPSTTVSTNNNKPSIEDDSYTPVEAKADWSKVTKTSKHKAMSYFGANVQQPTTDNLLKIKEMSNKYTGVKHFDIAPPGYYDYITYPHRQLAYQLADENSKIPINNGSYDIAGMISENENAASLLSKTDSSIGKDYSYGDVDRIFRLGDFYSMIPPEFLSASTSTSNEEIQGLRQSGSMQIKNGYSKKEIQASLILNGMDQINGYKVESPFKGKQYYVDGLRNLISQFKYTPFVPIENTVANLVHGVFNVAIRNISVETISGFPEALQVTLSMQDFNAEPYTGAPNCFFDSSIDWDLFRWFTQRPLDDSFKDDLKENLQKVTTSGLTNKFSFSILTQESLDKAYAENHSEFVKNQNSNIDNNLYVNVFKKENYKELINDKDNLTLTHLSFNMGNIMPSIQMSDHETPTMQYLGATDTQFSFGFETTDVAVAALFNQMNKENSDLVRSNRFKNGIGFLRIENELVQLTGTSFVMLNHVNVATMPGYPGTYSITITATSYDSAQKETEKLKGFRPFGRDANGKWKEGTKEDLISMTDEGLANKIIQECNMQENFQELEMYPDLHLPRLSEVDEAIKSMRAFRSKNDLIEQMLFSTYPRHKCLIPGDINDREYNGYVDPDFYTMCLVSQSDLAATDNTPDVINNLYKSSDAKSGADGAVASWGINSLSNTDINIMDVFARPALVPDVAKEPEYTYGYEPSIIERMHKGFLDVFGIKDETQGSAVNGGTGNTTGTGSGAGTTMPTSVEKLTGNLLADLLLDRKNSGCGYIWGACGQMLDEATLQSFESSLGVLHYAPFNTSQWIGKQVFDCAGLVTWGFYVLGIIPDLNHIWSGDLGSYGTPVEVSESSLQVGDILYSDTHAACYIGNGKVVEASGTNDGLKEGNAIGRLSLSSACRVKGLDAAISTFLGSHPNFYGGNSGSTTDTSNMSYAEAAATNGGTNKGGATVGTMPDGEYGKMINQWDTQILSAANSFSIDPNFIKAVMSLESSGDPNSGGTGDVTGLMQIYVSVHPDTTVSEMMDPQKNINYGTKMYADLGQKYGYDINKMILGYSAGESYVNSVPSTVSLNAGNGTTVQYYIDEVVKRYGVCLANGGASGSLNKPTVGGSAVTPYNTNGSTAGATAAAVVPNPYTANPEDYKNPSAGKSHGDKISGIDMNLFGKNFMEKIGKSTDGLFGKRFMISTSTISSDTEEANSPDHIVEYMYVDQIQFGMKGLLTRAFPSYLLCFIDEQTDWVDRKKLWSNYYVSRSAISLNVFESYDSPVQTAMVTLSNFNSNLTNLKISKSLKTYAFQGSPLGWANKEIYEFTGAILDEEITPQMIAYKNQLYDEVKLEEGVRIHIRMGYGSDPSRYPTSFNGTVVKIEKGEVVTLVAQSDGCELTNQPITDKTDATNKDVGLGEEVSDIMAELFVSRESDFLYALTDGFFKYKSRHGIEHFGLHFGNSIGNHNQYDIVKNIYKGDYEGTPFCKNWANPADNELNFRFFVSGKTVWDVSKMCEKALPEFVVYPRPFGFESRIFYGLPSWLCKYQYNTDKDKKYLYEQAKSFAQMHTVSSLDSIIDNNITVDTRGLYTNMIGIYSLGGDLSSTPVVMSDKYIDWAKQKTKTIDTTSSQDYWIPDVVDKLLSWTGMFDNGKQLAIMVCISELMDSWKNTYVGTVTLLGQPEIHSHDFVSLSDSFLKMSGSCTVRQVVHSMDVSSGFITTVTPGLIANNTLKQSGMTNVLQGALRIANFVNLGSTAAKAANLVVGKSSSAWMAAKTATYSKASGFVKNFANGKGKTIVELVKNGKIVTNGVKAAEAIKNVATVAKTLKTVGEIASVAKDVAMVAASAFPPALVAMVVCDILINILFTWIYDMFAYNNTISLNPLVITNPEGKAVPLVGNKQGARTLLPGYTSKSEEGQDDA